MNLIINNDTITDELISGDTVLGYIKRADDAYVEPSRQGTPKGDPIGFGKQKYLASLLKLTASKDKEIAKNVGVSFGVMRNWSSEEGFRKLSERHVDDCISFLSNCLEQFYSVSQELHNQEVINKFPSVFGKYRDATRPDKLTEALIENKIGDTTTWRIIINQLHPQYYGKQLIKSIFLLSIYWVKDPVTLPMGYSLFDKIFPFCLSKKQQGQQLLIKPYREILVDIANLNVGPVHEMKEILHKDSISKEEQEFMLLTVENGIEPTLIRVADQIKQIIEAMFEMKE